ncbi:MAG: dihydroorotate dehydrogenase electron transfer subunit [Prevotellaceae bacterium]|nr:dihydroorotate dehydrogenase electron transfer subunit [Prevotellaceae bacterium]
MTQAEYTIRQNDPIARGVYEMVLEGDTSAVVKPGQFVEVKINDCYLRRPISICDWDESSITLLYKVVGKGTMLMSYMDIGDKLDLLVGLGNGFSIVDTAEPMLVGGGIGLAPLYGLCKRMKVKPTVVIGAATKDDLFYVNEFSAIGAKVIISTDDGSKGTKGFVTDAIRENNVSADYVYACGPMPMMKAVSSTLSNEISGQFSLEERMGCGFGACVGCSIHTANGVKRVCKDGPVFIKEEILW